jgi:putative hemolysin
MNNTAAIIITLALSAFFSGMEIAFITSNKLKVELDKGKGLITARILSAFYRDPSRLIGTLLLGNNIALVIYGIAMANVLEPFLLSVLPEHFHSGLLILLSQTILATLIILFLAEFLPKVLFRINANAIITFFAIPLWVIYYFLYPIVYLFTGASQIILQKIMKIRFTRQEQVFTIVDLDQYIQELAKNEEQLEDVQQEIQMFQNMIGFRKVKLRETMVPRNEMIAIGESETVMELKNTFITHGLSRIPVYSETIDNIIGYAHSFDMFKNPQDIKSIIKPILYIPEFGGTSGMVTMEDIMEEIFGEIEDEFDAEEMAEKLVQPGEYIFAARLEIDYLNDKYKLGLPESEDYETLAGLIIHDHESIPAEGESILIQPFRFDILQASEARIELVRLTVEEE